jgi:hypothetical protein
MDDRAEGIIKRAASVISALKDTPAVILTGRRPGRFLLTRSANILTQIAAGAGRQRGNVPGGPGDARNQVGRRKGPTNDREDEIRATGSASKFRSRAHTILCVGRSSDYHIGGGNFILRRRLSYLGSL